MLSKIGDYEGTKKKIQDSYAIRDHFLVRFCSVTFMFLLASLLRPGSHE